MTSLRLPACEIFHALGCLKTYRGLKRSCVLTWIAVSLVMWFAAIKTRLLLARTDAIEHSFALIVHAIVRQSDHVELDSAVLCCGLDLNLFLFAKSDLVALAMSFHRKIACPQLNLGAGPGPAQSSLCSPDSIISSHSCLSGPLLSCTHLHCQMR